MTMACDLPLSCVTGSGADYCGCTCDFCCQDPCCDEFTVHLAAGFNGTPSECPTKEVCDGISDGTPFMFDGLDKINPLNLLYLKEKEFIFNPENNKLNSEELKITNKINSDYVFSLDLCTACCDCEWPCNEYDIVITTDGCCMEDPMLTFNASAFEIIIWGNAGSVVSWTPTDFELCCHNFELLANGEGGGTYTTLIDCETVLFTLGCTDDPCDATTQTCPDIEYSQTSRCCSTEFTQYQCTLQHDWGGAGGFRVGPKYKRSKNPKILLRNLLNRQKKIVRRKVN